MAITNSAQIGLENFVYSKITAGEYGTIKPIAPAISAKIKVKSADATLYGDNRAVETISQFSQAELELESTDLPLEVQADILGHTLNAVTGEMKYNSNDTAPAIAIGFKSKKANGKYRYVWLKNCKASEIDDEYSTTEDKVKFSTVKIKITAIPDTNGDWKVVADQDSGTTPVTDTFLASVPE